MAAFGTDTIAYTALYNALLKGNMGWLRYFPEVGSPSAGALTARITTAVSLQTPADGTMLANNAARTNVNLTAFDAAHTISLFSYELDQFTRDASAQAAEVKAFVDAAIVNAEGTVIADLVAGTAGSSLTLTVGQVDLATDATQGEIIDNLNEIDKAVAYIRVNTQAKPQDTFILMPATPYGNFLTLLSGAYGTGVPVQQNDGTILYRGLPVYTTSVTTNFGGASKSCVFVVHKDAEALCWRDAEIQDGFHKADDGLWKLIMSTYGFAGLIQGGHFSEVNNPAS